MPADPAKRKGYLVVFCALNRNEVDLAVFEKETIHWTSDRDSQNCFTCGLRFSLTRRRHHCRLCGKVLCSPCSRFLLFSFASANESTICHTARNNNDHVSGKIVNPAYAVAFQQEANSAQSKNNVSGPVTNHRKSSLAKSAASLKSAEKMLRSGLSKLGVDGSEVSINSFFDKVGFLCKSGFCDFFITATAF